MVTDSYALPSWCPSVSPMHDPAGITRTHALGSPRSYDHWDIDTNQDGSPVARAHDLSLGGPGAPQLSWPVTQTPCCVNRHQCDPPRIPNPQRVALSRLGSRGWWRRSCQRRSRRPATSARRVEAIPVVVLGRLAAVQRRGALMPAGRSSCQRVSPSHPWGCGGIPRDDRRLQGRPRKATGVIPRAERPSRSSSARGTLMRPVQASPHLRRASPRRARGRRRAERSPSAKGGAGGPRHASAASVAEHRGGAQGAIRD